MFQRDIHNELSKWVVKANRKPLVLRGARQVGKTTVVSQLADEFEQYIYLNLELPEHKKPFQEFTNIDALVETLFFLQNKNLDKKHSTLIFIDEIQEVPEAINLLRYFYEHLPSVAVIAAGSMLESLFGKNVSFPVGRVEYKVLRPVSFVEFLAAIGETSALQQLQKYPIAKFAHEKLVQLFQTYSLIGGMPEIVQHYANKKNITALSPMFDSLITSYIDDAEKYAANNSQLQMLRHTIRASFAEAGKRIKFEGFGNSNYKSREMGEVLRTLQKAMLLHLIYPNTGTSLPLLPNLKKSPRLQLLDTGLMNYFVGIQKEILSTKDLSAVYHGTMIEHLIGQELLANQYDALSTLNFWTRDKNTSAAEVDYLYLYESKIIPIEVKSGNTGTLRSLHQFMELSDSSIAVRFYGGFLKTDIVKTPSGKSFKLISLPYYLVSEIGNYLKMEM
jgi:predicted AAA+ superfamily ATPase